MLFWDKLIHYIEFARFFSDYVQVIRIVEIYLIFTYLQVV